MKKKGTRLISATLVCLLLLTLCVPALAAERAELFGYLKMTSSTNMRSSADASSSVEKKVPKNAIVTLLSTHGQWSLVDYEGTMGYVLTKCTEPYTGTVSAAVNVVTSTSSNATVGVSEATGTVNVRSGPSTSYAKLGQLKKGTRVTTVGKTGSWTIINWESGTAYVSSKYLKTVTSTPSGTVIYVRFLRDGKVYSGPSAANRVIASYDEGDELVYISTYDAWYKVKAGSKEGYVSAADVTFVNGTPEEVEGRTVFAKKLTVVYDSTGSSARAYTYMNAGDSARLVSDSNSTACVYYNGRIGYVNSSNIQLVSGTGAYEMREMSAWYYAKAKNTTVYSIPIESGSYRTGYLANSEGVWVIDYNAYWAKVIIRNRPMYVPMANLSSSPSNGKEAGGNWSYASPGDKLYISERGGADTFETTLEEVYIPTGERSAYGKIARGSEVTLMSTIGDYCLVIWQEEREKPANEYRVHTAFILKSAVK
ncbi:SH3 domain-containing protein [Christensenellaceae bacterium OttesenSCG-928-L17]|nr:SH3 domain-containing protein [Christensenellaceae bacterium OttesenSCG-928-L17]